MMKVEGLRGIYKGYGATIASFGPFSAIYLSLYDTLKVSFSALYQSIVKSHASNASVDASESLMGVATEKHNPVGEISNQAVFFLSGFCAGGFAAFVTNPLDLVKLRLQVQRSQTASNTHFSQSLHNVNVNVISGVNISAQKPMQSGAFAFHYSSMMDGLQQLWKQEGMRGLFKGASARVAHVAPASGISLLLFDTFKQAMS
jgi:hypothetical protein